MLQMSLVHTYSASLPVVKLGRIAGQFSKPRSAPTEVKDGVELPSYLGDNINGIEFTEKTRIPDPKRLFKAYSQSAATLNLIRAFSHGGFADLKKVHTWNLGFIKKSPEAKRFSYKSNPDYAIACLKAAYDQDARLIVLCDTNGGTLHHEVAKIISEVTNHILQVKI
jgi:3-deoxy-D-arabino-heptulosonate 7-phosphate (DAHP) synthase class II